MKHIIAIFREKILKLFCKHNHKIELYRCYQDRYVKDKCTNCGKIFYEDL